MATKLQSIVCVILISQCVSLPLSPSVHLWSFLDSLNSTQIELMEKLTHWLSTNNMDVKFLLNINSTSLHQILEPLEKLNLTTQKITKDHLGTQTIDIQGHVKGNIHNILEDTLGSLTQHVDDTVKHIDSSMQNSTTLINNIVDSMHAPTKTIESTKTVEVVGSNVKVTETESEVRKDSSGSWMENMFSWMLPNFEIAVRK